MKRSKRDAPEVVSSDVRPRHFGGKFSPIISDSPFSVLSFRRVESRETSEGPRGNVEIWSGGVFLAANFEDRFFRGGNFIDRSPAVRRKSIEDKPRSGQPKKFEDKEELLQPVTYLHLLLDLAKSTTLKNLS
ncbi:PREDICTED: uncharacterized protein LOC106745537 [Dinoponera quadriceps]|uniref:Uncharacterized protein LOC106745537 n=1 Tax=Dinoponera quadriceps TaxID=609295 RepID=A0A6P3XEC2_DINQU|nr:PREDICTED: uncharacterized protein LOC106745537 [Dinoponera quadriceps]